MLCRQPRQQHNQQQQQQLPHRWCHHLSYPQHQYCHHHQQQYQHQQLWLDMVAQLVMEVQAWGMLIFSSSSIWASRCQVGPGCCMYLIPAVVAVVAFRHTNQQAHVSSLCWAIMCTDSVLLASLASVGYGHEHNPWHTHIGGLGGAQGSSTASDFCCNDSSADICGMNCQSHQHAGCLPCLQAISSRLVSQTPHNLATHQHKQQQAAAGQMAAAAGVPV